MTLLFAGFIGLSLGAGQKAEPVNFNAVNKEVKELAENTQQQLRLVTTAVQEVLGNKFTGSVAFGKDYHTDGTNLFVPEEMGWVIALKNRLLGNWSSYDSDIKRYIVNKSVNRLEFTPERKAQLEENKQTADALARAEQAFKIIQEQVTDSYNSFVGSVEHEYKHIQEQHVQKLSKLGGRLNVVAEKVPLASAMATSLYAYYLRSTKPSTQSGMDWKIILAPLLLTATVTACTFACTELKYEYQSRKHEKEADAAIRKTPAVLEEKYKFYSRQPKSLWDSWFLSYFMEYPRPADRAAYFKQELEKVKQQKEQEGKKD